METMAQRIQALRDERGMTRPELAARLGVPKGTVEKLETGRLSPSKDQQQKLADLFAVSLLYLRGESNDRTRQGDWLDLAPSDEPGYTPTPAPKPAKAAPKGESQATVMDSVLSTKQVQEMLRGIVLDTLRSSEGQEILAKIVRRELDRRA